VTTDPAGGARALVRQRYPQAVWALVTGAVMTGHRTPGSDLDVVVLLPDGDPQAPHRESLLQADRPAELFVHDRHTLAHYLAKEMPERRPVLHRMVATGTPVAGDPRQTQQACAAVLAAGPGPLPPDEVDRARYRLTDLLDDLVHAVADDERTAITGTGWVAAADGALRLGGHWVGTGKWLLRELRDMDPALADRWLAAAGSADRLAAFVREVLDAAGGPLFDGYRAAGERPDPPGVRLTPVTGDGGRPGWLAAAPDGRPAGTAFLTLPDGGGAAELELHVHPAERRRGVGTRLLAAALDAARERGRPAVAAGPVEEGSPGDRFLAAAGFRRVLALTYTRLDLRAAREPDGGSPAGYRLVSWEGAPPDEYADTFAEARRAMDDMPMDDMAYEPPAWDVERNRAVAEAVAQRGDRLLTVAAVTGDGVIAGFTELVVPGSGTGDGQHYGTGVLPQHRGHGLARWMKAESIRLVRARFPGLGGLLADTADSNTFMRRVNDDLGYAPTHRSALYQRDLA
jgi:GNAT superfamily N-acetyltransferase